ncbi:ABC transporter related protein [Desulfarculus baarsii DSM 2075]|uniref:ABC transporter related protein n=1 Tax=Desulfarculus baarsii (strain ATCC 33931 / DSM 2075 / LMG 7858 / VKM B-1802 / 2st14) TaxID=644282 RepID=E1QIA5_DESB2|nr:ATP-binding cassette domain-containing protein [Desulfarculus baarsii]ADK85422.1 ABC transporter related protein [Desulfarculus baarsii DSM 2075]
MSGEPLLEARGLSKSFGALRALDGVNLRLEHGGALGVIGPNGSGKSTMFRLLGGLMRPDAGQAFLEGRPIVGLAAWRVCRLGLALTGQIPQPLSELTVRENVVAAAVFGGGLAMGAARRAAEEHLALTGLAALADAPSGRLTVVNRRRLELARALATRPKVILLDENLAGLTPVETDQALDLLRQINAMGVGLLMVEHVMRAVLGICRRVMVLDQGRLIAQGRPEEVVREAAVIEAYLGSDVHA